uniref:Uncharacterized protein n=1 Tax=Glossina brevipalpis TaxID=37001 RepID=A0A1A9WQR6_9MUSC
MNNQRFKSGGIHTEQAILYDGNVWNDGHITGIASSQCLLNDNVALFRFLCTFIAFCSAAAETVLSYFAQVRKFQPIIVNSDKSCYYVSAYALVVLPVVMEDWTSPNPEKHKCHYKFCKCHRHHLECH